MNMAQVHMCDTSLADNMRDLDDNDEVDDIEALGISQLQQIFKVEAQKKIPSRFAWGSMSTNARFSESQGSGQPDPK